MGWLLGWLLGAGWNCCSSVLYFESIPAYLLLILLIEVIWAKDNGREQPGVMLCLAVV
jgi:hypothetical protein